MPERPDTKVICKIDIDLIFVRDKAKDRRLELKQPVVCTYFGIWIS